MLRAEHNHEKEYVVAVDRPIAAEFARADGRRRPAPPDAHDEARARSASSAPKMFAIILTQGLNRQIRRMCEALGYTVVALQRVRIMHIRLGQLPLGRWRNLTARRGHPVRCHRARAPSRKHGPHRHRRAIAASPLEVAGSVWACPRCDRPFGKPNRPHECAPGMPIEVWLDERTEPQRRAAEAVLAVIKRYRGLIVEAVSIGVLIKRERTIVELRPKTKWLDVSFISHDKVASRRIARTLPCGAGYFHVVHLTDKGDVDAELRRWLAASLRRT